MPLLLLTALLAIFPASASAVVLAIMVGELLSPRSSEPVASRPWLIEGSLLFFIIFCLRIYLGGVPLAQVVPTALLTSTLGLALSHSLIHKYRAFNLTVLYRVHRDHHLPGRDCEAPLRKLGLFSYVTKKLLIYLRSRWSLFDFALGVFVIYCGPLAMVTALLSLALIEVIGFHQHSPRNTPIDCHNLWMNALSDNAGLHSRHHAETAAEPPLLWQFGAMTGLLAMLCWLLVCGVLRLLLFFHWPEANVPGAYLFGFRQNVGNYIAANGKGVKNLLYRAPSVFERPQLLPQYLKAMIRKERMHGFELRSLDTPPEEVRLSHAVLYSRNIYGTEGAAGDLAAGEPAAEHQATTTTASSAPIIFFKGQVIEGHHRYSAGVKGKYLEIVPK